MKHILSVALTLLCVGCKDESTPPPPEHIPTVQLTLDGVGVTEVWLKLHFTDASLPRAFTLHRNATMILSGTLAGQDTLLLDTNAVPRATYTYIAFRLNGSTTMDSSAPLQVTTMDTTSHNFTWETDTLGDASSVLSDVAIINDTLAYAVGQMYLRDSTGQIDPTRYNLAAWNGNRWSIRRVAYYFGGQPFYHPIQSVFAFNANDIWFCGNGLIHWDGTRYNEAPVPSSVWGQDRMNKIWGSSSSDLYIVGDNGAMAHYSGGTWQRVESGTTLNFHDIWGARNPRTGQMEILALASTVSGQIQESRIVQITGNNATPVNTAGLSVDMWGIWFAPGRRYYAVGAGIHQKRSLDDSVWVHYPPGVVTSYLSGGVRGTAINDVFVAGSFGEVVHFNGVSWYRYFGGVSLPTGAYGSISITDHLVMTVGHISAARGVVLIGRR